MRTATCVQTLTLDYNPFSSKGNEGKLYKKAFTSLSLRNQSRVSSFGIGITETQCYNCVWEKATSLMQWRGHDKSPLVINQI